MVDVVPVMLPGHKPSHGTRHSSVESFEHGGNFIGQFANVLNH